MENRNNDYTNRKTYLPLFEDRTYSNVLDESLARISDEFDKREGSIIYDALAPMSIEVSLLYSYLDFLFKNAFGSTANRYWLIERAKERGIEPYTATHAIITGKFDVELEIGHRFFIDDIYYFVTELKEQKGGLYYYFLQCELLGTVGNIKAGTLTPAQNIRNLKVAEIAELSILGEDDEDTEDFRDRYFESIKSNAYGGNIDDYRQKVKAIDGVGLVKVIPVWNGGGTVKLIITDTENNPPTEELVTKVQEIIDPIPYRQKGIGVAPIGHYVTVEGAVKKPIDIKASIMLASGTDVEVIKKAIRDEIESYLTEIRKDWSAFDKTGGRIYIENDIRLTKIMSIILNIPDVIDYKEISFNGSTDKILILEENEIPFLNDVNVELVTV